MTGALLLGAAGAALAPAGPDALVPFKLLAASAAQVVGIEVVVQFGDGTVTSHCAHVAAGSSDEQALAAVYPVVTNSSGLICDINNDPTSDTSQCLRTGGNGNFYYWSYFEGGSGNWQYANVGPASSTDDVEGWRFQNPGPDNPSAPPPQAPPSYAAVCGTATTTTQPPPTTEPPPPPTTTTTTAPAPAPSPAAAGAPHNPAAPATTAVSSTKPKGTAGGHQTSTRSGHTTTTVKGSDRSGSATTTSTSTSGSGDKSGTGSGGSTDSRGNGRHAGPVKTALASASVRGPGTGGAPILPIVLIGIVIALLAALGAYRWRQRPAEE